MRKFRVRVNGEVYEVELEELGVEVTGKPSPKKDMVEPKPKAEPKAAPAVKAEAGETEVTAPMPGVVLEYKVNVGDEVKMGQTIVMLEAMKMENEIPAAVSGTVKALTASKGQSVNTGEVLAVIG